MEKRDQQAVKQICDRQLTGFKLNRNPELKAVIERLETLENRFDALLVELRLRCRSRRFLDDI